MSTLAALASDQATPEAQAVLSGVRSSLGLVPNLFRVVANSPAALNAYVAGTEIDFPIVRASEAARV